MYSDEQRKVIYDAVCEGIAAGKSLRKVCEEHSFPLSTVMHWRNDDRAFLEQYTRAREDQADFYADQIMDIADAPILETPVGKDKDDEEAKLVTRAEMERRKQQIDARKWIASKLKPKAYGDKLDLSGGVSLTVPDDQLESRLAILLGKAGAIAASGGEGTQGGEA